MNDRNRLDGLQRLRIWGGLLLIRSLRLLLWLAAIYRVRFGLINVPFALVSIALAFFGVGCAHHDDTTADHPHHHEHHGNYGGGSGGQQFGDVSSRAFPAQSATPIPGL